MSTKDRIGMILTALSIAWLAFLYTNIENYVWFAPYIQTKVTQEFSLEEYRKIQRGMTRDEVVAMIGLPLGTTLGSGHTPYTRSGTNFKILEATCDYYSDDNGGLILWDFAWVRISVCYEKNNEDIVIGKVEQVSFN